MHGLFWRMLLLVFLLGAIYLGYSIFLPNQLPNNQTYKLVIDKDQTLRGVTARLHSDNVINDPRLMLALTRILGKDKKIVAGLYLFKHSASMFDIIKRITNGKPDEITITILDGWTFKQVRSYINSLPEVNHVAQNMTESQILASLKIPYTKMEGLIYPSTYFIAPNQSDLEIYQSAYKQMQLKLNQVWDGRNINTSNYSGSYQLLIMASLIQKETSDVEDMLQISTVFNNRLRSNMRLQDDPAVFYGLENKARITRQDFQIDTPYNTYLHSGLPPTPICTPSQAALEAAANPGSDYKLLYFIAIGNGRSKFSYTFEEHSTAVNKYLRQPEKKGKIKTKGN